MRNYLFLSLFFMAVAACNMGKEENQSSTDTTMSDTTKLVISKKDFHVTSPIPLDVAQPYRQEYVNTITDPRFPKSFVITRESLESLIGDPNVKGVRVFPIIYTKDDTRGGFTFIKGSMGHVLVAEKTGFTGELYLDVENMWDYNQPCPPQVCLELLNYGKQNSDTLSKK